MNHLAHLYLSQNNISLMVGNFIADRVKGKAFEKYDIEIQKGIEMHRAIDSFTDSHPIVQKSKERLYPVYHKYASVIVDMFYDHVLAKKWKVYSPISLHSFSQNAYKVLQSQVEKMPLSANRMLQYMQQGDWLSSYASLEGIEKAMGGLASRAKFDSKMEYSTKDLSADYDLYEKEFTAFFPLLIAHVATWSRQDD